MRSINIELVTLAEEKTTKNRQSPKPVKKSDRGLPEFRKKAEQLNHVVSRLLRTFDNKLEQRDVEKLSKQVFKLSKFKLARINIVRCVS